MEERGRLFIGASWTGPSGDDVIEVISPHTEELEAYVDLKAISGAPRMAPASHAD